MADISADMAFQTLADMPIFSAFSRYLPIFLADIYYALCCYLKLCLEESGIAPRGTSRQVNLLNFLILALKGI